MWTRPLSKHPMETSTDTSRLPGEASPFWIHYPLDILQQYLQLSKHGERLRLWYNGADSIVTVVLAVHDSGHLVLDVGPDPRTNKKVLATQQIVMNGQLDGVELKGPLGPLSEITHDGLPAFLSPLPHRLHRLQRREFHRVVVPVGLAVKLEIPERLEASTDSAATRMSRQVVKMLDISLGGVAFEKPAGLGALSSGLILPDCHLQLDDLGIINADLEVRYEIAIHSRSGTHRYRVGCRFHRLSTGADNLIQRFNNRLELDQKTPGPA